MHILTLGANYGIFSIESMIFNEKFVVQQSNSIEEVHRSSVSLKEPLVQTEN